MNQFVCFCHFNKYACTAFVCQSLFFNSPFLQLYQLLYCKLNYFFQYCNITVIRLTITDTGKSQNATSLHYMAHSKAIILSDIAAKRRPLNLPNQTCDLQSFDLCIKNCWEPSRCAHVHSGKKKSLELHAIVCIVLWCLKDHFKVIILNKIDVIKYWTLIKIMHNGKILLFT